MLNIKKLKPLHIHKNNLNHEKYKETLSYQEGYNIQSQICAKVKDIRKQHNISDCYEVFEARLTTERLREIISFIREVGVDKLDK